MFQPVTIQSLSATFFVVFEEHVDAEHIKHAPAAPFLGAYLQGSTFNHNDKVTNREENMVRQRKSKVLGDLRRKVPFLTAF